MECKTIHKKAIFFLEKELPPAEIEQIKIHLNKCQDCALFFEELKLTLGILEMEKSPEVNPFFYTRLKAKLENQSAAEEKYATWPSFVRVLRPVAFSILLVIGIYSGIKIGQPSHDKFQIASMINQGEIPFLNEMEAESIEAFLME